MLRGHGGGGRLLLLSLAFGWALAASELPHFKQVILKGLEAIQDSRTAGLWRRDPLTPDRLSYELVYPLAVPGLNGTSLHEQRVRGDGRCGPFLSNQTTVVFMKTTSNELEKRMFDIFFESLMSRGLGLTDAEHDEYNLCYLEPVFEGALGTCNRTRRCIPKFMMGTLAKVAFAYDVLLRMGDNQVMVFLDTDTVALRPLKHLALAVPQNYHAGFMAASPGPNTGVYAVRRSAVTVDFWEQWFRTMKAEAGYGSGPSVHDQAWTDVLLARAFNVGPTAADEPARHFRFHTFSEGVTTGGAGRVNNCSVVYHAIHTRDYAQKAEMAANIFGRYEKSVCAFNAMPHQPRSHPARSNTTPASTPPRAHPASVPSASVPSRAASASGAWWG